MTILFNRWVSSIFLVGCIICLLLISIKAVLKPPSPYEANHESDSHGIPKGQFNFIADDEHNKSSIDHFMADTEISNGDLHSEKYNPMRYPLLYRDMLQQAENGKVSTDSLEGNTHVQPHLKQSTMKTVSDSIENGRSDGDLSSTVRTKVSHTQPQGLHVNMEVQIQISDFRQASSLCHNSMDYKDDDKLKQTDGKDGESHNNYVGTRNVAVVFFLPRGCYADQQEIEVTTKKNRFNKII